MKMILVTSIMFERYNPTMQLNGWLFSITYIFCSNALGELKVLSETFKHRDLV